MDEVAATNTAGILHMVLGSGPVVQAVLLLLIVLSVWSWTITIAKYLQFRKAREESDEFSSLFWESRNFVRIEDTARRLEASPLAKLFEAGHKELGHIFRRSGERGKDLVTGHNLETVERALNRAEFDEVAKLEKGITFLATVASAAPFIGLFGTVWGIMNAFHGLSYAKSTTIQAVAPGISEALVATAVGLAAAIPAAVAYNYCAVAVRRFRELMQRFSAEFVNVAKEQVDA
ncbi:MAG: protein TolQ [Bdellovibrionota bacterium]|nr:MAG: protein TolQ [Bdellovibrionota bacterium]